MAVIFTGINERFLRIYDGTTPTPYYVTLFQVGQPDLPGMEPRSETAIQTDGGRMTQYAGTYTPDETVPFQGVPINFTVMSMSEYLDIQRALGNWMRFSSWTVGGDTWLPVAGTAIGNRLNSAGTAVAAVPPKDQVQLNYMVNLAWTEQVPTAATSGVAIYGMAKGVVVNNVTAGTENNLNIYNVEGMIYGSIDWTLTDWPAGTESTPS